MYNRNMSRGGVFGGGGVVKLDQVPRWSESDLHVSAVRARGKDAAAGFEELSMGDPLTSGGGGGQSMSSGRAITQFKVDPEINWKLYIWQGAPWNLEVDAVVNSTNENLDEAHSSPGLHAAAGPGLAEECAGLGGCRTGMAKITSAYELPARRVIHTVGPRYALKYHTAAENALSHCYRSCLELMIENDLQSIAMSCIYTESKGYPREPAAHVALRTVRRFLEKHKDKIRAIVLCTSTATDSEIYKRLLPLYFPRDKYEEEVASSKLPADVGDENGETVISERKIRISALPAVPTGSKTSAVIAEEGVYDEPVTAKRNEPLDVLVDPSFMLMTKDPDQRKKEQWEKASQAQAGWKWSKRMGFGGLNSPPLSLAEEESLRARYLARANAVNLAEVAEMKILYRGGVDTDGRPVLVIVGAHFLLRCLNLEHFILYVVKEFEPIIQRRFSIVYFHSAAALQMVPDLGWMKRVQQILGQRHRRNLQAIYILHPTLGLKATILALQVLVDQEVVYVERLLELFKFVPREQLTIPDFVFQHDLEVNGDKALGLGPSDGVIGNRSR
ncbi:hypothetical protein O6H91_18G043300 [Diphasiastrum complanatum]|uniref:Uncharacterized protein n=1 Tax=Diphasiastrum complanatum TaxID=34168 RepID=A0ACC2B0D5_DIPCM|nr:hypothetical protein O6H91_18G043300 [Diphasiastrum complanatum]